GTDAIARLLWQSSSRAVGPVIPLPRIGLKNGTDKHHAKRIACLRSKMTGAPALNASVRESRHHATFYILYYSADRCSEHN
ncbi:MAG TPA: hypothetical protein VK749_25155, partial [Xanthobacteraceae bacterium]|nr:hypothetical protein [Xanthobacteraceae bacterium]